MRLKRFACGMTSALILSASTVSVLAVNGADSKVKIAVSNVTASAGDEVILDVSLDIPSTGLQSADFSVTYDSSIVSIVSVDAGPLVNTGAEEVDVSSSVVPVFGSSISTDNDMVSVYFAEPSDDSQYFMKGEGVMFSITCKVSPGAQLGEVGEFKIVPTPRKVNGSSTVTNDKIWLGYDSDPSEDVDNWVTYDYELSAGSVTVGTGSELTVTMKGDANEDNEVDIADAVAISAYVGDSEGNPLSEQGKINADVQATGNGVNANDALAIQQYLAKVITEL